jgi:peptide/nickel transport system substrate-binding protein
LSLRSNDTRNGGRLRIVLAAVALAAAGCGAPEGEGRLTLLTAADVDSLDPGRTYSPLGYQVLYATNRPLYSYAPGDGARPRPDLAEGPPRISRGGRRITVRIRAGVRYAPPLDREVVAADVEYAIERAFSESVASSYAASYFGAVAGAPAAPTDGVPDIAGIAAPDERTLVLRLTEPVAGAVAGALAMPITVPVPREHAAPHDARSPSDYDRHVASTGPYMVRRAPAGRIDLVRNPHWTARRDFRPAWLDRITIDAGNVDLTVAARRALEGSRLVCCDAGQPPPAVLAEALGERAGQVGRVPGGGTRWIALNTRRPPFDDLRVRTAVVARFDRTALRLVHGGARVGPVARHFIPPGVPGHAESRVPGPSRAPALPAAGKGRRLLIVSPNADPGRQVGLVVDAQLRRMGFRTRLRAMAEETLLTRFCGVPSSPYAVCAGVSWSRDFLDGQSALRPPFDGRAIAPRGSVNWSLLDDPRVNAAMSAASALPPGAGRDRAWARVNRMIVERAVAIPYLWDDSVQLASADVDGAMNPYFARWDLAFTRLR